MTDKTLTENNTIQMTIHKSNMLKDVLDGYYRNNRKFLKRMLTWAYFLNSQIKSDIKNDSRIHELYRKKDDLFRDLFFNLRQFICCN